MTLALLWQWRYMCGKPVPRDTTQYNDTGPAVADLRHFQFIIFLIKRVISICINMYTYPLVSGGARWDYCPKTDSDFIPKGRLKGTCRVQPHIYFYFPFWNRITTFSVHFFNLMFCNGITWGPGYIRGHAVTVSLVKSGGSAMVCLQGSLQVCLKHPSPTVRVVAGWFFIAGRPWSYTTHRPRPTMLIELKLA